MDPLSFIRFLGTLGRIDWISTLADALPDDPPRWTRGLLPGFRDRLRQPSRQGHH